MKYYYARVSTKEQNLERKLETAKELGIENVYADKASGKDFDRIQYQKLKEVIQPGDELYVKELDRLGRNLDMIKEELDYFRKKGVILRIMDVPTTMCDMPGQEELMKMLNNIIIEVIGTIAQQERRKIRQRQREGIDCMPKDKDGKIIGYGRKRKEISEPLQYEGETVKQACARLGMSRSAWYRAKNRTA